MIQVVITVIGDDRAGLVDRLSGVINGCDANWERSHLAELAGKFAGVIVAAVPDADVDRLVAGLDEIESTGLLHIAHERSAALESDAADLSRPNRFVLKVIGQDHKGIVHEISHALAEIDVSIDELQSEVVPAPMGGSLFEARASLDAPGAVSVDDLSRRLEAISPDLMIDLEPAPGPGSGAGR